MTLNVQIKKLNPKATLPTYGTDGAGAFDIYASEYALLEPGKAVRVPTGLAFEIPLGHVLLLFSRSGHGYSHNIRLTNCVGVIDSDYRGEVLVLMTRDDIESPTLSTQSIVHILPGDRIAQGIILPSPRIDFEEVFYLSETERGTGGFGSTGA